MRTKTERVVVTAFFVATVLIGIVSWFEYRATSRMETTSASITHAISVMDSLDSLLNSYLDAETGARGFIITSDEKFLQPYLTAVEDVPRKTDTIRRLVKESSVQSMNLQKVEETGKVRLTSLETTLELKRAGKNEETAARIKSGHGKQLMDQLRVNLGVMNAQEEAVLMIRQNDLRLASRHALTIFIFGNALAIFLICCGFYALRRESHMRAAAQKKLQAANATLEDRVAQRTAELSRLNEIYRHWEFIFNHAGWAVAIADNATNRITMANPAFAAMHGYEMEELAGKPVPEIFAASVRDQLIATVRAAHEKDDYIYESKHERKDGSEFSVMTHGTALRDASGKITFRAATFLDITRQKKDEAALRESEGRFKFLHALEEATRSMTSPGPIMEITARLLGEHLRVSRCAYADVDADSDHFTIQHDYTQDCPTTKGKYQLALFGPRVASAMREGRTLVIRHLDQELNADDGAENFRAIQIQAIICCPLVKAGKLEAMLAVHQTTPRPWTDGEIKLVETVAERCWSILQRARAEAQLRDAQTRLQSGIFAASVGTWVWDIVNDRLYADDYIARIFSVSPEDAAGGPRAAYLKAMHPEDAAQNRPFTVELLRGQDKQYDAEYRLRQNDGSWRWFNARAKIERDTKGRPLLMVGAIIDITDRKATEQALHRSESLLRTVTNEARVGLVLVDQERRYLFANASYAEILDLPGPDIVGQRVADVLPLVYHQIAPRLDEAFSGQRVTYELHTPPTRQEESERIYEVVYEPRTGPGERAVIVVIVDITQRKAAEEKLRESEQQLRSLINGIPNLAWRADPDGSIYWYNDRWYEYTGTTPAQMEGWGWTSVHDPAELPRVIQRWKESIASGEPFEMVFPLRRADGEFGQFLTRIVPLRDTNGKILFWFGTNTDVTAERETAAALATAQKELASHAEHLEEQVSQRTAQLQESLKTMENYNYSIAHDLRSPLRGMMGFADMLLEDYLPKLDDTGKDYLRRIKNNARRMDDLVRDLLEYGRLTHVNLPLEELDLELVVKRALEDAALEIENSDAQINVQYPLPSALGNTVLLSQILQNLITNAIKFVAKNVIPQLTIRAEQSSSATRLWVEDNGLGIELAHQKRIFEMFQRLHTQEVFPGTGIGLAIVKKGMERMGGDCGVESERGKGSRFWIELPLPQGDR